MNRNSFWIHFGLAAILITFAGVLGQMDRWRAGLRPQIQETVRKSDTKEVTVDLRTFGEPEVLVRFRPNVTRAQKKKIAELNNDRIEDRIEIVRGLVAIDDLDDADPQTVADHYAAMSDLVEYAEPNYRIQLELPAFRDVSPSAESLINLNGLEEQHEGMPNDPYFKDQWGLNNSGQNGGKEKADVSMLAAWKQTKGSEEIVVAVLDSGVDYNHPDLAANMWVRPSNIPQYADNELGVIDDRLGFNGVNNAADPMDENGHGTHCAGIIGAEGNNGEGIAGINWNVKIMPLKFLGRGGFGSTKDAVEAINYAVDRKRNGVNVRVINASFGSALKSKALEDAIKAAGEEGILFVAAAGNNSTDNDRRPYYPAGYDLPNVISVAAMDNQDLLASFSNFGSKTVHLAAPGKDIISTWLNGGYREASGTSMAAPHVAGIAALILANNPDMSVAELRERVVVSVDAVDILNGKLFTGGRINAAKAIAKE